MKAILLKSFDDPRTGLSVETIELPSLQRGDVLIKIAAASINPSDLVFLRNQYGIKKKLPIVPGLEGSGTVMASGGGFMASRLVGKRVACRAPEAGHGTWAEYMVCSAEACIPLLKEVSLEQGASLIVNPLTAWLFLQQTKGHRAFVQTAAASALGKMLVRLAKSEGVPAIHVVRRPEQIDRLKAIGAEHVLNSEDPDFSSQLTALAEELQATIAFDAVGGALTAKVLQGMPKGSRAMVYGALAGQNVEVGPADLIFKGKSVGGFWLTQWVKHMSLPAKLKMMYQVQKRLGSDLKTDVRARYPLERWLDALEDYKAHRSAGKVLLTPGTGS